MKVVIQKCINSSVSVDGKEISKDGFYNYHPKYVEEIFEKVGFKTEKVLSVSNFRSKGLKKIFKTDNCFIPE